jgi:acyl-CoA thioesterase-1
MEDKAMAILRICLVGDEKTNASGAAFGWFGQLCRTERVCGNRVLPFDLTIPGDTSTLIADRWRGECERRFIHGSPGGLVFTFGASDMSERGAEGIRVGLQDTLANAEKILGSATSWRPTLWVGPAPDMGSACRNDRLAGLNAAFLRLASDLKVPYFDLFSLLPGDKRWSSARRTGEAPGIIAEKVRFWEPWRRMMAYGEIGVHGILKTLPIKSAAA